MVLATEGLAADVAGIGPFVGVGAFVDEEIVGLGELAIAVLADELLLRPRIGVGGVLQLGIRHAEVGQTRVAGVGGMQVGRPHG